MKKLSILLALTFLILGGDLSAQNSAPYKVDGGKFSEEYAADAKSAINTKVMNTFNKRFSDASNVIWSKDKHRIDRVYFERQGKVTRAAFNQKGQFLYSITTYGEELLPKDVLVMVKKTYYGRRIFGVTEVEAMEKKAYLIILEDSTSWLQIKVLGDELSEEKFWLKAN